jgi:hypothetical protein
MATRLYPQPYSVRSLEFLAGVPEGTHKRLRALEARHPNRRVSDAASRRWYKALERDPNAGKLSTFLSDGWKSVNAEFCEITEAAGKKSGFGSVKLLDNPHLCAALLRTRGLDPEKVLLHIRGLEWG